MKDTKVVFFNIHHEKLIAFTSRRLCKSKHNKCCVTGAEHTRTSPNEMEKGMFRHGFETKKAEHYPPLMCEALADAVL